MPCHRTDDNDRTAAAADVQELTVWQWYDLLRGNPLITGLGFSDDDELADAWLTHGDRVMDLWLRHFPGRRAFGWWLVEAPEERRLLPDLCPVTLANLDNWREHGNLVLRLLAGARVGLPQSPRVADPRGGGITR